MKAEKVIISDAHSYYTVGGTRVTIVCGADSQVHEYATGIVTITDKEVLHEGHRLCYCDNVQWGIGADRDNKWVNDERTSVEECD